MDPVLCYYRFFMYRNEIWILGRTMDGTSVGVDVLRSDQISKVKETIVENMGLPLGEYKLDFQGDTLDEGLTVDDYEIEDRSVINVVRKLE